MGKIHIGTMGWSYSFWLGNFYPEGLTSKEYLTEYSKHLDTVEVNNTFYRIPRRETVIEWKDRTPADFLFAAKFPRIITHVRMLRESWEILERFIERISELQGKLGPLLLQLPSGFKQENIRLLSDLLSTLPKKYRFAVEVRNRKLLEDPLFSLLRRNGVALTLVDSPLVPCIEEMTADFAYIRLEGDRTKVKGTLGKVEVDRTDDIKRWVEKLKKLGDADAEVFVYVSKYYSGHPPTDAMSLSKLL